MQKLYTLLAVTILMLMPIATLAKPDMTPLGKNIADTKSAYYDFTTHDFVSKETKNKYRVWVGVPKKPSVVEITSTTTAYPVLYMLDGNSVMAKLNDTTLQYLASHKPVVLVIIGYQTNLPFDLKARTLDYTPPDKDSTPNPDPNNTQRMSGGSSQFRQFLENSIVPWVNLQTNIDPKRVGLWGHSYGGLFVLDSLQHSHYFTHYFSASPSLSWADNRMLTAITHQPIALSANKKLTLMEGEASNSSVDKLSPRFSDKQSENLKTLMNSTQQKGVASKILLYPNLSHGEVFGATIDDILKYHYF